MTSTTNVKGCRQTSLVLHTEFHRSVESGGIGCDEVVSAFPEPTFSCLCSSLKPDLLSDLRCRFVSGKESSSGKEPTGARRFARVLANSGMFECVLLIQSVRSSSWSLVDKESSASHVFSVCQSKKNVTCAVLSLFADYSNVCSSMSFHFCSCLKLIGCKVVADVKKTTQQEGISPHAYR